MRGVAVTVLVVGLAVAVMVTTCRRKREASDRGMKLDGGSVRVGRRSLSARAASLCIGGIRERRAKGCDSEGGSPEKGRNGGIVPDQENRRDSMVHAILSVTVDAARSR